MKKIEKSDSSPIYERIRDLAQQHKISLAELERSLQFSNGIISTWKFSNPSIDKVKKVANYFNVSIDYLLGNNDSVDPQDQQILEMFRKPTNGLSAGKNRLKELRNQRKLTLDDIEEKTGIKRGTYSNYENGKTEPKMETWQKLADYFGTSVSYIKGDLDTEYLEKIVELLMLINFPNVCLKYRNNELNDSWKPFFNISITSQIIKLLGYDSRKKFKEIYKKSMRLGDNPENSIEVKAYKEQFFKILTTSKEITNHLLKEYEKIKEK